MHTIAFTPVEVHHQFFGFTRVDLELVPLAPSYEVLVKFPVFPFVGGGNEANDCSHQNFCMWQLSELCFEVWGVYGEEEWCQNGSLCCRIHGTPTQIEISCMIFFKYFQSFTSLSDSHFLQGTEVVFYALFKATGIRDNNWNLTWQSSGVAGLPLPRLIC